MTTREAIEAALVEDPDDLASHAAYADLLHEEGDPRGDLIQVQLALEDPTLTRAARKPLVKREKELLEKHQRDWLGPLAPFLLDNDESTGTTFRFARAWVASLTVPCLTPGLAAAITASPLKLLTELHVETSSVDAPARNLAKAKDLAALRVLKLGKDAEEGSDDMMFPLDGAINAKGLPDLVGRLPHLTELHVWTNQDFEPGELFKQRMPALRYLKLYHVSNEHPLEALAANPTLGNLTHLLFQPPGISTWDQVSPYSADAVAALGRSPHLKALTHLQLRMSRAGDDGVRALLDSGLLGRLTDLDLSYGYVTDAGARLLAAAELPNLRRLDLSLNRLTDDGLTLLSTRPWFSRGHQWQGEEAYFEVQFE